MTPFVLATMILKWTTLGFGWLRGGHVERLAVTVLFCDHAISRAMVGLSGGYRIVIASECVVAAIFVWLALRSGRWWTLVASAALLLCILVFVLEWVQPDVSRKAAMSARIGLWWVISLSLMIGVWERWLAGEAPVSPSLVWRRRRGPGAGAAA